MFKLKPISKEAIPAALEKVERYRLLNEPQEAESICRDILQADPDNEKAVVKLILALSDQVGAESGVEIQDVKELLPRLTGEYEQKYYEGIIYERRAKAALCRGTPGCQYPAYDWLRMAMDCYEQADDLHPESNEDAKLRWNTCARMIMQNNLEPQPEDQGEQFLE